VEKISWTDFEKLDIRLGTVLTAERFEGLKKPAFKLSIDFGDLGVLRSSAQLTVHYTPDGLVGRQVTAVVNFPPKQIRNFFSECLVLGIYDEEGAVVLLQPDRAMKNGSKIG
jgi:tRNA-binding protein